MRKYFGKYRVLVERDINGEVTDLDFTYLVGTKNNNLCKIYRYNENILSLLIIGDSAGKFKNFVKKFHDLKIPIVETVEGDMEGFIRFSETHLDTICGLIDCKTNGADIVPESIKNHPNYKEIKKARFESLSDEEKERRKLSGEMLRDRLISKS